MGTLTTNYNLYKPAVGETGWGALVNAAFDTVDSTMFANAAHASSNGSSHTFIDQDVTSGSSPTFDGTNFTGVAALGVAIADAGGLITATDVENALQEHRGLINTNTAKVSNATHTTDVTGSVALTIDPVAITNKGAATVANGDLLLISDIDDSNNLKQVTAQSIANLGAGGSPITVEDEGTPLTTACTLFDFAGAGVTVTEPIADQVLVTIPGGGAATDLNLTGQAAEDFVIFNGTNWVAQGGTEKISVVTFTRDQTVATGTQAVTGVGFKPSAIHFIAGENSTTKFSSGHDDGTTATCWHDRAGTGSSWERDFVKSVRVESSGSDIYSGLVSSFDADGFTFSWTKAGSPTGTVEITALCFR